MRVPELVQIIRQRVDEDKDLFIVFSGEEGEGKSTVAIELTSAFNGKDFVMEKHVLHSQEGIEDLISTEYKKAILIDEGMDALYKRDWMSSERKRFNRFCSMCRKQNMVVSVCIPSFWDIDPYFRNHRIKLLVHVIERGIAVIYKKDRNLWVGPDVWHMKENFDVTTRSLKRETDSASALIKAYSKTKGFVGILYFDKLPANVEAHYAARKKANFDEFMKRELAPDKKKTPEPPEDAKLTKKERNILLGEFGWKLQHLAGWGLDSIGKIMGDKTPTGAIKLIADYEEHMKTNRKDRTPLPTQAQETEKEDTPQE